MPYFRRYRKTNRRNRKLTKANIYGNRSARAQSRQIARINSKVNYLTKINRPEILTLWKTYERTFTNATLSSNYETEWFINPWQDVYAGRSFNDSLQGTYCRAKGFNFDCITEYSDNYGTTNIDEDHQRSASYKIVILQYKNATPPLAAGDVFDSVFNIENSLTSADSNITQPLRSGIKSVFKVLYCKSYVISYQKPIVHHRIKIPASRMINFALERNPNGGISAINGWHKGSIRVCVLTGGLHADSNFNSIITMSSTLKIAFTDN